MIGMPVVAFISGVGGGELVVIFLIFLLLFGAKKMPGIARSLGKSVSEFQRAAREVREEFLNADRELNKTATPSATPALPEASTDAAAGGAGDHPDSAEYYGSPETGEGGSGGPIEPVREAAAGPVEPAPDAAAAAPAADAPAAAPAPEAPAPGDAAPPADAPPADTTSGHVDEAPKA